MNSPSPPPSTNWPKILEVGLERTGDTESSSKTVENIPEIERANIYYSLLLITQNCVLNLFDIF